MSSALNRLSYDPCAYKERLAQSVTPMSYVLDPINYENCNKCRVELGLVGGTAVSHIGGNLVDLENNLLGLDRPGSLCDRYKYQPVAPGQPLQGTCGQFPLDDANPCYKTNAYPRIDTTPVRHLPACQFQSFPTVPMPPAPAPYSCP